MIVIRLAIKINWMYIRRVKNKAQNHMHDVQVIIYFKVCANVKIEMLKIGKSNLVSTDETNVIFFPLKLPMLIMTQKIRL